MLTVPPASPSLSDGAKTKRDTGVLSCSVGGGVEGKQVKRQQAGGLRAAPVGGKKLTEHISSTVQSGDGDGAGGEHERRHLGNNMDSKQKKQKSEERPG